MYIKSKHIVFSLTLLINTFSLSSLLYAQNTDTDTDLVVDTVDLDDDNDGITDIIETTCAPGLLLDYSSEPPNVPLNGLTVDGEVTGFTITHSISGDFDIWEGPEDAGQVFNIYRTSNDSDIANAGVMTYNFSDPVLNLQFSGRDFDNVSGSIEVFRVEAFYLGAPVDASSIVVGTNMRLGPDMAFPAIPAGFYGGTTNNTSVLVFDNFSDRKYEWARKSLYIFRRLCCYGYR